MKKLLNQPVLGVGQGSLSCLGIGGEGNVLKPRMCQVMTAVRLREISVEMGNTSIMGLVGAGMTEPGLIRQRERGYFALILKPLRLGGGGRLNERSIAKIVTVRAITLILYCEFPDPIDQRSRHMESKRYNRLTANAEYNNIRHIV